MADRSGSRGGTWALIATLACVLAACGGGGSKTPDAGPDAGAIDPGAGEEVAPGDEGGELAPDLGPAETLDPLDTQAPADVPVVASTVRFVHISDIHVHGQGAGADGSHVQKAVKALNALAFPADFVVATGDYVDYLPEGTKAGDASAYQVALSLLSGLKWPLRTTAGNHEYYRDDYLDMTQDKAARDEYLVASMGHPRDYAFDVNGVRFLVLDSMEGARWADDTGLVGSYTDDQLAWIADQLAAGRPTFLLTHHPPNGDYRTTGGRTLCETIQAGGNAVKGIFAGHLHGFWKGEACGRPYYLAGNLDPTKPFHYEVEYDPQADRLTIGNEADLPFTTFPTLDCDPATPSVADPAAAVGTNQVFLTNYVATNQPGLESVDGFRLSSLPTVVHVDGWDPATSTFAARLTIGKVSAGFVNGWADAPCVAQDLKLAGGCVTGTPAAASINVAPVMGLLVGVSMNPAWKARLEIRSLWLEGRVSDVSGVPTIGNALLHVSANGQTVVRDLHGIVVSEYCAGNIKSCPPGAEGNPACPAAPDEAFFDEVPEACDVAVGQYSIRLLLGFLASYPLENIEAVAVLAGGVRPASATPANGAVSDALFSTEAGANCAGGK